VPKTPLKNIQNEAVSK